MKQQRKTIQVIFLGLLVCGFVLHFAGGSAASGGVPAVFALTITLSLCSFIAAFIREPSPPPRKKNTEISLPKVVQDQASSAAEPAKAEHALEKSYRRKMWSEVEAQVDLQLDTALSLVKTGTGAHTAAVFFPTNDGGYMLRKFTTDSAMVNPQAILYPGVGVLGCFLKDGLKKLNLDDIVNDSSTLSYYLGDAKIRSLIAAPLVAGGKPRGALLADSLTPRKFGKQDEELLGHVASLCGQSVLSGYLFTEHKLQHERLAAISAIEKEFFQNLSRKAIVQKLLDIVPRMLPCDRLTISLRNDETSAHVAAAAGRDADAFTGTVFPLTGKSLAAVLYANNIVLTRNYAREHYEVRYVQEEPHDETLVSFVAVPLGVDRSLGMLLIESSSEHAFDEASRELLCRLGTSAGLAIEKLLVFEKANALATHDGLTGLYNHRTFQQMLAEEITRAIRYTEPLSMVICDIDHFKKVNDTYGHPFGDVVLKSVSQTLQSSVRQDIDTVSRYGGEEFAIILVKTDTAGALETAERIRSAVASVKFNGPGGKEVLVTMSFGIAEYKKDAKQINELIAKADKALYRAKENGRNRVEVF